MMCTASVLLMCAIACKNMFVFIRTHRRNSGYARILLAPNRIDLLQGVRRLAAYATIRIAPTSTLHGDASSGGSLAWGIDQTLPAS